MDYSKMNADKLRQVMTNAKVRNWMDIYWEAAGHLARLSGADIADPLEREFYHSVALYEGLLFQKHGKHQKAGRTWQMFHRVGLIKCIEHAVLKKEPTEGFNLLMENNMGEFVVEALVLKYPERFSPEAITASKKRLGLPAKGTD